MSEKRLASASARASLSKRARPHVAHRIRVGRLAGEGAHRELADARSPRTRSEQLVLRAASSFLQPRSAPRREQARLRPGRARRSQTPLARKPASTPSRAARHSTVSRVGRVLPRSIWETYSFENRSPARSLCVSPAANASCRSRSPSRSPAWAADGALLLDESGGGSSDTYCVVDDMLHQNATCPFEASPERVMYEAGNRSTKPTENHLDRAT